MDGDVAVALFAYIPYSALQHNTYQQANILCLV